MNVLLIGGTGLISTGIIKHLLARNARITMYNRGQRENTLPPGIEAIQGNRDEFDAFEKTFADRRFDVVIDMICFGPEQAQSDLRAFAGRCEHFIVCSTVCTYTPRTPPGVLVNETFEQKPISEYGQNKLKCEQIFLAAHQAKKLNVTIVRPSSTYGQGNPLIDNLEPNAAAWDRIQRGLPVLCSGDGMGLWVATHRDDCGKLFAYAAMNPKTYGQCYNATRDRNFTWRDYYREGSAALGCKANLIFMPAAWIFAHDPKRFGLLREITQFHGAYSSEKAKHDLPEYRCEIDFKDGAAQTFADVRRRNAWRSSEGDSLYQSMIDKALAAGVRPVEA
jgi:nucleoside-diphosphate-sugar epimerase